MLKNVTLYKNYCTLLIDLALYPSKLPIFMSKILHYSPAELVELYPQVSKIGWTPVKIGMMFRCGLFVGYTSGKEKKAMILEESFVDLMKYITYVNKKRNFLEDDGFSGF